MPRRLCSPIYRCFPPQPTICAVCGVMAGTECPLGLEEQIPQTDGEDDD